MPRRILPRAALLCLLAALTAPTLNAAAGIDQPAQAKAQAQAERMIKGAQKEATYDEAGRAVKTAVPTSENEKVNVTLKYDERNRIQSVVLDDGMRIGLVYDETGLWQGFAFPDGGKMLFKRNASGEITGARRVSRPASQQTPGANAANVRRVGLALTDSDCAVAVAAMVAAAASATATCLEGPSVQCAAAVASAAVAAAKAYSACKDKDAAEEESAV